MAYHQFIDWNSDELNAKCGSFETFYHPDTYGLGRADDGKPRAEGYYWWPCFPGCLPDSEPIGPFGSEQEAIADAQGTGQGVRS